MQVVCKLLDLGHAGLGHAELGQRDWDRRYKDSGTGTRATRTICLFFYFFVIQMLKEKIIFLCDCMYVCNLIVVVVTNTTVESLR